MPHYDTNSTLGQPVFSPKDTQIPFDMTLRVVPEESGGRRMVTQRSGQWVADMIQTDLVDAGWTIATPVTYVPAFGNNTAKIMLRGFFERDVGSDPSDDVPPFKPTQEVSRIHSGTVPGEKTAVISGDGGGGNLAFGQNPVAEMDVLLVDLISAIEAASSVIGTSTSIEKVDLMGVYYGKGARNFPQ